MKRLLLALACLSLASVDLPAEELCPGCGGGGAVGCPACASPFGTMWVGKCNGCNGYGAWSRTPGRCNKCGDTGVCQNCHGKGQACMVCKGSGRVPDGTGAAVRERRAKESMEKITAAMKPVEFMAGTWKGEGRRGETEIRSEYSWERVVDASYLALVERTTVDGETHETAGVLTYNAPEEAYKLYVFNDAEGNCALLSGQGEKDGSNFVFKTPSNDNREIRLKWRLDAESGRGSTTVEVGSGEEWEAVSKSKAERTGDSALKLKRADPAGKMAELSGFVGSWDVESEVGGKQIQSRLSFRSVLGGHWFAMFDSGKGGDAMGMLGYVRDTKKYILVIFGERGDVGVYNGKSKGKDKVVLIPNANESLRWTWTVDAEAGTLTATMASEGSDGKPIGTMNGRRR